MAASKWYLRKWFIALLVLMVVAVAWAFLALPSLNDRVASRLEDSRPAVTMEPEAEERLAAPVPPSSEIARPEPAEPQPPAMADVEPARDQRLQSAPPLQGSLAIPGMVLAPPPQPETPSAPVNNSSGRIAGSRAPAAVASIPAQPAAPAAVPGNGSGIGLSGGFSVGSSSPSVAANGASGGMEDESEAEMSLEAMASMAPAAGEAMVAGLDEYKVKLGVTEKMYRPGPKGELKVWIGSPQFEARFSDDLVTAETTVAARGTFASVEPFAPDFEVEPAQSICVKIDPSGTDVRFSLEPKKTGSLKVSAQVLLYTQEGCPGSPVSKTADPLQVVVEVDYILIILETFWEGYRKFWVALFALLSGLLLFLVRKKLKKWFGYDGNDGD